MRRGLLACIAGFAVGLVLFLAGILVINRLNLAAWHGIWDEPTVNQLAASVSLFDFALVPLVVFVASLTAALIARHKFVCGIVSAAPFVAAFLILNSFDGKSLLIALAYCILAIFACFLASLKIEGKSSALQS